MHEEALLAATVNGVAATAHPAAIERSSGAAEPLRLDNLEGLFLLCSVATAAAALAIAAEALIGGGNVAGFLKCVGVYVPEGRERRNCDTLARKMRRNLNLLPK